MKECPDVVRPSAANQKNQGQQDPWPVATLDEHRHDRSVEDCRDTEEAELDVFKLQHSAASAYTPTESQRNPVSVEDMGVNRRPKYRLPRSRLPHSTCE